MTDDLQTPAPEAGDEVVREEEASASEATENTDGQDEHQPAEDDAQDGEKSEDTSPSKARRERRKAEMERLRHSEAEARTALETERQRREKIAEAAQASQPPKESDFADYNDFLMAAGAFHAAKAWDDRQTRDVDEKISAHERQLQEIQEQQKREVAQNWDAAATEARNRYADFDNVALNPQLPVTQEMGELITSSDTGADVLYFLGTHPQEAARIATLTPLEQARALGAIEARLSLPKPNTQTKAPDPISPLKGKAGALKDPSKMTMAEYAAARKAGKI